MDVWESNLVLEVGGKWDVVNQMVEGGVPGYITPHVIIYRKCLNTGRGLYCFQGGSRPGLYSRQASIQDIIYYTYNIFRQVSRPGLYLRQAYIQDQACIQAFTVV